MADSKYLLLDPHTSADPNSVPKGELKGVVKRVRTSGANILITMEAGDFLELKVGV
jgi:ABC-type lipopolysaccharide export system ATPase subunit